MSDPWFGKYNVLLWFPKKMRVFRCKLSAALAIYILSSVCFPRFLEPGLCRSNTDTLLC